MKLPKHLATYFRTFYKPSAAFNEILAGKYFLAGFLYMMIPLVLYTLMYIMLWAGNGAPSTFAPWLDIPRAQYYYWNRFLVAPSMVIAWFAAAAVMQVLARALKGTGSFEATLGLTGLSISVAMWSTLLHDLLMSFFSMTGVIDARLHEIAMNSPTIWRNILWACFALYLFAFPALFYTTVRAVHGLSKARSFFIALVSFLIFQLIFLVFNR